MFVYLVLLFVVFTPGVFFNLPFKVKRVHAIAIYALLFTLVWTVTHKLVRHMKSEGLTTKPQSAKITPAPMKGTPAPMKGAPAPMKVTKAPRKRVRRHQDKSE